MGNPQKLGNFVNALFQDASNNVGIGGSPSGSYKLEVTGTAKVSSTLLVSGQLTASTTNGGTSAIFQNTGVQNSNGIELRGGTAGTSVNWRLEKDNTVSNALQITPSTTNGGTTFTSPVMTITSTGNVGIGTSSPTSKVTITDTGVYGSALNLSEGGFGAWVQGSTEGLTHAFIGNFKYNFTTPASSFSYYSGTGYGIDMCDGIRFFSAQSNVTNGTFTPTERMRITSGGDVHINGSAPLFTSRFGIYETAVKWAQIIRHDNASTQYFINFQYNGTNVGNITGNNTNTQYNTTSSDLRLKKNFEEWDENLMSIFKNINPQLFNFNIEKDNDKKTKGFIAQEMVQKFPEAYPIDADGFYCFNPSGMVVYLMKGLKEAATQIEDLKLRLDKAGL